MKVFISGATGFIGGHLIKRLTNSNAKGETLEILGLTRSGAPALEHVTWAQSPDIRNSYCYAKSLSRVDVVVHLAAAVHSPQLSAAEFSSINVAGTVCLAQAAIQAQVPHFLYLSSVAAVGQGEENPITENTPCNPDTPYGKSKLDAEIELHQLCSLSSMALTVLRPTVVYGAGDPGNVSKLVTLCRSGLPLPFASIKNVRSFLSVENLVDAICRCLANDDAKDKTFLVSDVKPMSTAEFISLIYSALKKRPRLCAFPVSGLKCIGGLGSLMEKTFGKNCAFSRRNIQKITDSLVVDTSYIQEQLSWKVPFSTEDALKRWLQGRGV